MKTVIKRCSDGRYITMDISEERCKKFGLCHKDLAINPNGNIVLICGVALGNDGKDALWYVMQHPSIKDEVCYWGGKRNLIEAGFKLLN